MDTEEAIIRIKDHMERHRIGEFPHIRLAEALNMAISALRVQLVTEKNTPLTLKELRGMDLHEWVWVENLDIKNPFSHKSNYYQKLVTPDCVARDGGTYWGYPGGNWHMFYWSDYGKTWIAYRQKPKEEIK